jgi:hypothetical protein
MLWHDAGSSESSPAQPSMLSLYAASSSETWEGIFGEPSINFLFLTW